MTFEEALRELGLDRGERDPAAVRVAYLRAIRASHPDLHHRTTATAESARVTTAYRLVIGQLGEHPEHREAPAPSPPVPVIEVDVSVISDDTIEVAAPTDLTYAMLLQAAHEAGDVTFLDRSAAILQMLITFVDEPACQVIFDLQGRAARGTTEIFCTIESIEDRPAPPIDAVTRFVAERLAAVSLT